MGGIKEQQFRKDIADTGKRAADAEDDAAKANKETAKINERAVQLQAALELENKKQQARTLTTKQREDIINEVRGKVDKVYIIPSKGMEPILFDAQIASAFHEGGVTILPAPVYDGFPFSGLKIYSKDFPPFPKFFGEPVVMAFMKAGIIPDVSSTPPLPINLPTDAPVILIGEKLPDLGWPLPLPDLPEK